MDEEGMFDPWAGCIHMVVVTALGALLKYLILPHKPAFVRRIRQIHGALGLPDSMRITSDVGDGISDSFCVEGVVGLFITGLVFFMLLMKSIWDPRVTVSDAFWITLFFLVIWWAAGISARRTLEEGPRDIWGRPRHF